MMNLLFRFTCAYGLVLYLLWHADTAFANDIQVASISLTGRNTTAGANNAANFISVQFNLSWSNSWCSAAAPFNWDAAWVFVKFRVGDSDPSFTGVSSSGTTVTVSSTANLRVGMPVLVTSGTGAFAANTVISSITNSTQFVVSATPATALSSATIVCSRIWEHAWLNNTGHTAPSGSTIDPGLLTPSSAFNSTTNPAMGVFIYRSTVGKGPMSLSNVQLRWNYGAHGVPDNVEVDIRVSAIEMVYVPQGSFIVGSGGTETNSFTAANSTTGNTVPFQIMATAPTIQGNNSSSSSTNLSARGGLDLTGTTTATLATGFPTGFGAFYCMKYEVSQGMYRDFLNTLTRTQQDNRIFTASTVGNYAGGAYWTSPANYVLGPTSQSTPLNRIGVRLITDPGGISPRTYACDLNPSASLPNGVNQSDDGEWIPMGFTNWMDAAAFLDWSGLRPMTELEFEKVCRGIQAPLATEYAWGTASYTQATTITNGGTANETLNAGANMTCDPTNGNAGNSSTGGPIRVGSLATASTSRSQAGASFYGIMDLSGNVWERMVSVGNATGRAFNGSHGDGSLSANGHANALTWPGLASGEVTTADGDGLAGGAYNADPARGLVSARNQRASGQPTRTVSHGFRGVRSTQTTISMPWTLRASANDNAWNSVTFGNGLFVAVARNGSTTSDRVMTSPDGITWTPRTVLANDWNDVAYGSWSANVSNKALTSNVATLTTSAAHNFSPGQSVTITGVDATFNGTYTITSTSSTTFTYDKTASNVSSTAVSPTGTASAGLFVATASTNNNADPTKYVMTSPDGITWTPRTVSAGAYNGIAYGNGFFVAVNTNVSPPTDCMRSSDGVIWTPFAPPALSSWRGLTFASGQFVAVAASASATTSAVMTSTDGNNWAPLRTAAANNSWYSVVFGNGLYAAVSITGTGNRVMTSPDGITWTSRTSAVDNQWYEVAFGNGKFVAVAQSGNDFRVMSSTNGIDWVAEPSPTNVNWRSVIYGNGRFVAVGQSGTGFRVMTSDY